MAKFNLAAAAAADTFDHEIVYKDQPTGWIWTLAGPGHDKTIDLNDRFARKALAEEQRREQARVNGRKFKSQERSPEEMRAETIDGVLARVVGFTPVDFGDGTIEYSEAKARELLFDRRYGWLFVQIAEALGVQDNFLPDLPASS